MSSFTIASQPERSQNHNSQKNIGTATLTHHISSHKVWYGSRECPTAVWS
jgi:ribosomal protein L32